MALYHSKERKMRKRVSYKKVLVARKPLMLSVAIFIFSFALIGGCGNSSGGTSSNGSSVNFSFEDVTLESGLGFKHGFMTGGPETEQEIISGGAAAGDYDKDGWVDIYAVSGDASQNFLYRNMGDGTFQNVAAQAGLNISDTMDSGPTFADYNGDGDLDIFIGGVAPLSTVYLFENNGNGTFSDVTEEAGLSIIDRLNTFSAAFGDYDLDGDLDLFMTHWGSGPILNGETTQHLWRNNSDGTFTDVSIDSGIAESFWLRSQFGFTPNWSDINNDGYPDMLLAADFGNSRVFVNQKDGTFLDTTNDVIDDENGMGAAVGDFDNDLDFDWFVSSIYDTDGVSEGHWGITGNRLYRNIGNGQFEDATVEAGVEHGFWGWGSCFADLNNDGYLDIVHVNGFTTQIAGEFTNDPTRVFISNGDGTFNERAKNLGLDETGQGRGINCFDYDNDGDIDIYITNNNQEAKMFRNNGGNQNNYLTIKLNGLAPNTKGIGAKVVITASGMSQIREIRAGSNFVSQNPAYAHFGLGQSQEVESVKVTFLDGSVAELTSIPSNQMITVDHPLN